MSAKTQILGLKLAKTGPDKSFSGLSPAKIAIAFFGW